MTPTDLPERIASKIEPEPMSGCWLWTAWANSQGYGYVAWDHRDQPAHRIVWELLVGPIPKGLDLDHLCRNRICVSPWHHEPVTRLENNRRGNVRQANIDRHAARTHCPQGHPYDEENTYRWHGGRQCKVCRRKAVRDSYRRRIDRRERAS